MRDGLGPAGEITLPFPVPPEPGAAIEIARGLLWARMPLPMRLDHVNVWLIAEGNGWTAVDCGLDTPETHAAWEGLLAGPLCGKPVRRLVASHGHVDHVGLAGWLVRGDAIPFHATLATWLWARVTFASRGQPTPEHALQHLRVHGCAAQDIEVYSRSRGPLSALFHEPPAAHIRLNDGGVIMMGGRPWTIITADGHADEHASFHDGEGGVLIAGDQVLQRISPMVGVFAGEPVANPLAAYLASLERFRALPPGTLVLPSHGLPFFGLHPRLHQLALHHARRLELLADALDRPLTATECSHVLFSRAVAEGQWYLALAESLAHLHHLELHGEAVREVDKGGVVRFARR